MKHKEIKIHESKYFLDFFYDARKSTSIIDYLHIVGVNIAKVSVLLFQKHKRHYIILIDVDQKMRIACLTKVY